MRGTNHSLSPRESSDNPRQGSPSYSISSYYCKEEKDCIIPDGVMALSELEHHTSSVCDPIFTGDFLFALPQLPSSSYRLAKLNPGIFESESFGNFNANGEANEPQISTHDDKLQQRILTLEKELRDRDLECRLLEKKVQESEQRAILAEEGERLMSRRADIFGSIVAGMPSLENHKAIEDTMSITERKPSEVVRSRRTQRVRYNSSQGSNRVSVSTLASPERSDCQSAPPDTDEFVGSWHYGLRDTEVGAITEAGLDNTVDEEQTVASSYHNPDFQSSTDVVPSPSNISFPALSSPVLTSRPMSLISSTSFSASWELPAALGRAGLDGATQVTSPRYAPPSQPKRMRRFSSASGGLKVLILPNTKALPAPSLSTSSGQLAHLKLKDSQQVASSTAHQPSHPSTTEDVCILTIGRSEIKHQHGSEDEITACIPLCLGRKGLISHLDSRKSASGETNDRMILQTGSRNSDPMATTRCLKPSNSVLSTGLWLSGQPESSYSSDPDNKNEQDNILPLYQMRLNSIEPKRTCCHSLREISNTKPLLSKMRPGCFGKPPEICCKQTAKIASGSQVGATNSTDSTAPVDPIISSSLRQDIISNMFKGTPEQQFCKTSYAQSFTIRGAKLPELDSMYIAIVSRLMAYSQTKFIMNNFDHFTRTIVSKLNTFIDEFSPRQVVSVRESKANQWQGGIYQLWIQTLRLVNSITEKPDSKRAFQLRSLPWWWSYVITFHYFKNRLYNSEAQNQFLMPW